MIAFEKILNFVQQLQNLNSLDYITKTSISFASYYLNNSHVDKKNVACKFSEWILKNKSLIQKQDSSIFSMNVDGEVGIFLNIIKQAWDQLPLEEQKTIWSWLQDFVF